MKGGNHIISNYLALPILVNVGMGLKQLDSGRKVNTDGDLRPPNRELMSNIFPEVCTGQGYKTVSIFPVI